MKKNHYITFIYFLLIMLSISCCSKKKTFHENKQVFLFSPSLNDTIKKLVLYDYPKKWEIDINKLPSYNSTKDSLADKYFMSLLSLGGYSIMNQSFNILLDPAINDTIKKTILYNYPKISLYIDEALEDSLKASPFTHEVKRIMWDEENYTKPVNSELKNFNDSELKKIFNKDLSKFAMSFKFKWDAPYFIGSLYETENYILNIYRDGDYYKNCTIKEKSCDFFIVNYILLETINKKTGEGKYFISNIDTNCKYQYFNRLFYLDIVNNKLITIDFYWDEVERYFLGRKEYNLN